MQLQRAGEGGEDVVDARRVLHSKTSLVAAKNYLSSPPFIAPRTPTLVLIAGLSYCPVGAWANFNLSVDSHLCALAALVFSCLVLPGVRRLAGQAGSSGVATTQPSSTVLEVVRRMLKQVRTPCGNRVWVLFVVPLRVYVPSGLHVHLARVS